MKDYFKRIRVRDGFKRLEVSNKTARTRAKQELKKIEKI